MNNPQITRRLGTAVERHRGRAVWLSVPEAGLVAAMLCYVGPLTLVVLFTLIASPMPHEGDFDTLSRSVTIVNSLFTVMIVTRLIGLARSTRTPKRAHAAVLLAALALVMLVQTLAFSITDAATRLG